MRYRFELTFLLVAALLLMGCASQRLSENRDEVFGQAVEASLEENHAFAAAAAFEYLRGSSLDDPRYDRALRLLAVSTENLGLSYPSSLFYLDIANARRDPELIDDAVEGLERLLRNYPYEYETIMAGFVATAEVSGLPPEQIAFLNYYQGLESMKAGLDEWAEKQFAEIPERSPYKLRARYAMIVREVRDYELDIAREQLEAVLEEEQEALPDDLRLDIHRTLARIAFEQQRYDDALDNYQTVRVDAPNDPSLLLEMAWSHYYLGEYERTLGLLTALDAPSYQGLIAPERYLLEAIALQQMCQFEPAREAAVRLQKRYGEALDDLYDGVPLEESDALREAARLRAGGEAIGDFSRRIRIEAKMVDDLEGKFGEKLAEHLRKIYDRGVEENRRLEDEKLVAEMERLAQELLAAEEGVRLILHELGVSLLRGRRRADDIPRVPPDEQFDQERPVLYRFNGEFWTDELDDLVVRMEDRCIEE